MIGIDVRTKLIACRLREGIGSEIIEDVASEIFDCSNIGTWIGVEGIQLMGFRNQFYDVRRYIVFNRTKDKILNIQIDNYDDKTITVTEGTLVTIIAKNNMFIGWLRAGSLRNGKRVILSRYIQSSSQPITKEQYLKYIAKNKGTSNNIVRDYYVPTHIERIYQEKKNGKHTFIRFELAPQSQGYLLIVPGILIINQCD